MEMTDSLAGRARGEDLEQRENRDSVYDMNYEISVWPHLLEWIDYILYIFWQINLNPVKDCFIHYKDAIFSYGNTTFDQDQASSSAFLHLRSEGSEYL